MRSCRFFLSQRHAAWRTRAMIRPMSNTTPEPLGGILGELQFVPLRFNDPLGFGMPASPSADRPAVVRLAGLLH